MHSLYDYTINLKQKNYISLLQHPSILLKHHSGCSRVLSFQASTGTICIFDKKVLIKAVIHSESVHSTTRVLDCSGLS